ncbi:MAG: hypothetical protein QOH67_3747 [Hyphomicrobiales bacterium]|jgi:hypothetical protein|nr:hypothetical protein [Hyphomicrobiales bacterium]
MRVVVANIKWIMLAAGVLTCTMIYAAIAPQAALRGTFGETLDGPLAEVVVRNWAVLITLIGAMLIYGAYHAAVRPLVLAVAALSKLVFIALVLAQGSRYLGQQAGIAIAIDAVWVVLFALYLAAARSARAA